MAQVARMTMTGHNSYKVRSNQLNPKVDPSQPMFYQIRRKGHLGGQSTASFDGPILTLEESGDTLLTDPVVDHAVRALARSGRIAWLAQKVRDLGLPLLSVNRVDRGQADASTISILDTNEKEKMR
jgi:hypothetical protein